MNIFLFTGTTALLAMAMIYHAVYNTLVQSSHQLVGFLVAMFIFKKKEPALAEGAKTDEE